MCTEICKGLKAVTSNEFNDPTNQASSGKIGDRAGTDNTIMHGYPCFKCGKRIFLRNVIEK